LAGTTLVADHSGALWWPGERILAVADLHFEKGSAYAAKGTALLPPYDTRATIERLEDAIVRREPRHVICMGDSFHDGAAGGRLSADDRARLSALARERDWLWLAGNHDPAPPSGLGGRVMAEIRIGPLVFRHQASADSLPAGEVSGHFHPKAVLSVRGRSIGGRCFAADARRLVLPAFGSYAGGLNVLDPAIAQLFTPSFRVHVLARERVHTLASSRLLPP